MLRLKKNWVFFTFIGLILVISAYVIFSVQPKSGVIMIEQLKTWGNVELSKYKLDNGLSVITVHIPDTTVFAYYTWFNVGSRHEKKGKTGIAHFFEHLMFKETKNMKEGQFERLMEMNGASTNAATWVDWTYYYETLPADAEKLEMTIRIEADRMQNMIISQKQIDSEREVILNERRFRVDNNVDGTMSEKLDALAFEKHPYGQPTIGWVPDIKNLNLDDYHFFYKTYYAPNNATIILVGKFDRKQALKWIEQYYGAYETSTVPQEKYPTEPPQKKAKQLTIRRTDVDSEKVIYGYHVPGYAHDDTPALELLSEILFNGEGSRLYKLMVQDEEIAQDVDAWVPHLKDPTLFEISISMRNKQPIQKSHNRVFREIKNVQKQGVTKKELDRAKNRFEMEYYKGLESVGGKARAFGHYEIIAGDYKEVLKLMQRYHEVSLKDIQRVAKTYLNPENRSMVVALPQKATRRSRRN